MRKLYAILFLAILTLALLSPLVRADIVTVTNFNLSIAAGQSRVFMDLANGVNITLTVTTGTLNSANTSFNSNSLGGSFTASSTTGGILQVTSTATTFALYLNGVYSATNTFTFTPNTAFTITWGYSTLTISINPATWIMDVGQSQAFTATATGGSGTYSAYHWYVNGVAQAGTSNILTYTPTLSGTKYLTVSVTDNSGATSLNSTAATITVYNAPNIIVSPYTVSMVAGETQSFTLSVFNGTGLYSNYHWYVNGTIQASHTTATYSFTTDTSGVYLITASAQDSTGLTATSPASTVTVTDIPTPTATPTGEPTTPTPTPTNQPTVTPIPIHVTGSTTWYFRSDTYTTFDVTGYGLDSDYTSTSQTINSENAGNVTVEYGFQVYLFSSATHASEITRGVSGLISLSSAYVGYATGTYVMPKTPVVLGYEAIKVSVLVRFDGGTWIPIAQYVTPLLLTNNIEASTWTFSLYTNFTQDGTTYSTITFGDSAHKSGISGVALEQPLESALNAWRLQHGDVIGFVIGSYVDVIGEAFYALILLACAGSLYRRYGHFGTVAFFFVVFGGVGGIVWVFVPLWAAAVVSTFVIIGITFIVWRLIR